MNQKEIWNTIADSWSNFRTRSDIEVAEFSKNARGTILDVGCGNCKNLIPFLEKKLKCVGVDFSKSMIKEAKKFLLKKSFHAYLVMANANSLPFKSRIFSKALFIRTLSTIETKESRLNSLKEVKRTSKKTLITVWKKWQLRYLLDLIKHGFSSDIYIDWNYYGKTYKRFYHKYTKKELETELKSIGFKIKKIWENREGNICAVVS